MQLLTRSVSLFASVTERCLRRYTRRRAPVIVEESMARPHDNAPWLDISVPIGRGTPTFDGDLPVELERTSTIAHGDICNISRLACGVHTGTHVDSPVHFVDGAGGIETVAIDALVGPALVVDATGVDGMLDAAAFARLPIPAATTRLLVRSRNSALWSQDTFQPTFVGVTEDGARALVDRGIRLVGIDYLSIAPFGNPVPTHTVLLEAGVVIVEGLDLRSVQPGEYDLICLPILIPGSDGGPARAVIRARPDRE